VADPRGAPSDRRPQWSHPKVVTVCAFALGFTAIAVILIVAAQSRGRTSDFWFYAGLAVGSSLLGGVITGSVFRLSATSARGRVEQVPNADVANLKNEVGRIVSFVRRHEEFDYLTKLRSIETAEIADIFTTRSRAYIAMRGAVQLAGVSEILIAGVTLSDFVTGRDGSPWTIISEYLRGVRPLPLGSESLTVKVLICDPQSFGARLSRAPTAQGREAQLVELEDDVKHVCSHLRSLQRVAEARGHRDVRMEFRVSRVLTQCFVLATDHSAYVQPYYLLQTAGDTVTMPVLLYGAESGMRAALGRHFDVLWSYASADPDDPTDGKPVRIDRGAGHSGLVEIYTDATEGRAQMARLLESARHRVWIQGISNVPVTESPLNEVFEKAAHRDGVNVRVLVLDPRCETACQKTFALFQKHGDPCVRAGWQAYRSMCDDPAGPHQSSSTYHNVRHAIDWFSRVAEAANSRDYPDKVAVRLCSSVNAFMLVVDDHVLLEPYHYGDGTKTEFRAQTPLQLADDMPLFEFHAPNSPLFRRTRDGYSNPLRICETHIERVFRDFSWPVPDDLRAH
jgi:hypothetical protein